MANMANTRKTVQVVRWSSRKRRVAQANWTRDRRNDFSRTPVSPKSPPKWGKGNFFLHCHKKMPILFHSGNKRQFKLCSKSVSNNQNQLVEAEKLFKKSHIFAWFHCMLPHEKYTRARIITGPEAVDLIVNEVFGISVWSLRVRIRDFSEGLWLGFGKGYFSVVMVWVGIFQFG